MYNQKHDVALSKVCITSTSTKTSEKIVFMLSAICILYMFHCYNNYIIKKLLKG